MTLPYSLMLREGDFDDLFDSVFSAEGTVDGIRWLRFTPPPDTFRKWFASRQGRRTRDVSPALLPERE